MIFIENGIAGLRQLRMRKSIGEYAEERLVGSLTVEPFQGTLMNQVGRILLAVQIIGAVHSIRRIGGKLHSSHSRVTP